MMREALHDIRDDPTAAQSRVSAWIHVLAKIRQHSSTFLMVLAAARAGIDERMRWLHHRNSANENTYNSPIG